MELCHQLKESELQTTFSAVFPRLGCSLYYSRLGFFRSDFDTFQQPFNLCRGSAQPLKPLGCRAQKGSIAAARLQNRVFN